MDDMVTRLAVVEKRVESLEVENLARRVAMLEPVVARMESKMEGLEKGLCDVKSAILELKSLQRGVAVSVIFVVAFVQFLPYLGKLL